MNYQRIPGVAALIVAICSTPLIAQTREEIDQARAAMRSATTALKDGKLLAHREAVEQVVALRPDYPTAIYILAQAYAREKNAEGALTQLELLARMGLEFEPGVDSAFATLFENKRFRAMSAQEHKNTLPLNQAVASDSFNAADFHPDGVTYDAMRRRFCIGSVRLRKVTCRNSNGSLVDFGSKA